MEQKLILPEQKEEDLIDQEDNITQLKLLPGGKDGNWLWKLHVGAVFLTRPRPQKAKDAYGRIIDIQEHNLMQLEIVVKEPKGLVIKLYSSLNEEHYTWEDSKLFSERFDLVTILYEGNNDE